MLDVSQLDAVCPDWRERQAWVCGPAPIERCSATFTASAEGGHVTFATSG